MLGVKIPAPRLARFRYPVKHFIAWLSVRTRSGALVVGNAEVGGERLHTEFTEAGAQSSLRKRKVSDLNVFGFEARVFGDSSEHLGPDLHGIVEGPCVFTLGGMSKLSMGAA